MKYLKARRGQAFETMMLVISVIVALAILAVLLNILNIVKIFNPSSPKDVMSSGLKDIQSKGFGITTPQKVTFAKGANVLAKELISDIPITVSDLKFFCSTSSTVCGTGADKPLKLDSTGKILTINNNIEVFVVVCGNEQNGAGTPKYCVALDDAGDAATKTCSDSCKLTA